MAETSEMSHDESPEPMATQAASLAVRPATMADLEAVMAMINACERADEGRVRSPINAEEASWKLTYFDLARDSLGAFTPDGRCAGIAEFYDETPEHVRGNVYLNVAPEFRSSPLASQLLDFLHRRLATMEAMAAPGLMVIGHLVSMPETWPLFAAFDARGWRARRHSWTMARDLAAPLPEPVWPPGVTARPGAEADQAAFADHYGFVPMRFEDWRSMAAAYGSEPALWILAFDGPELVGLTLNSVGTPEDPALGYVGDLGVRRDHRGKGLGLALLHAAFRFLADHGCTQVQLDVDSENLTGATRLYERAGMHVLRKFSSYEIELRTGRALWTTSLQA
jgi:mycothiol synthase